MDDNFAAQHSFDNNPWIAIRTILPTAPWNEWRFLRGQCKESHSVNFAAGTPHFLPHFWTLGQLMG